MAYSKTNWIARVGTALNRFLKTNESDTSVELTNDPSGVTTPGTPFTAANMNKIEQGIYDSHYTTFTENATLENITSGEELTSRWGKIKKAISVVIDTVKNYDLIITSDSDLELLAEGSSTVYENVLITVGTFNSTVKLDLNAHGVKSIVGYGDNSILSANYIIPNNDSFISVGTGVKTISSFKVKSAITQTNEAYMLNGNGVVDCNVSNITAETFGFSNFTFNCSVNSCRVSNTHIGFYACRNLVNCVCENSSDNSFQSCNYITNCKAYNAGGAGFNNSDYITNCLTSESSSVGFIFCDYISTSQSIDSGNDGFSNCEHISLCLSEGSAQYGFDNCDYVTNCKAYNNTSGDYDSIAHQSTNEW